VKNLRTCCTLFAFITIGALAAQSQATRTWVSGVGDDLNSCSRTAPCKTWAGAISKTSAGGEIDALDPAGFGAVTITKSITLDGGGGQVASVLVSGTNGITVVAGPNDVVALRNLRFQGLAQTGSGGLNGIQFTSGAALHIESCTIMNFTENGIYINVGSSAKVYIDDTVSRDNGGDGLDIVGSGGTVYASVSNSRFLNNANGVVAGGNTKVTVEASDASGNSGAGFEATSSGGTAVLTVADSVAGQNLTYGLQSAGGSAETTIYMSHVTLSNNAKGTDTGPLGKLITFENNQDNGNPVSGGKIASD